MLLLLVLAPCGLTSCAFAVSAPCCVRSLARRAGSAKSQEALIIKADV